jgi:nickel-type superoxide dismutase maturation protease
MGVTVAGLWRWHPVSRVEVTGDSMAPALEAGDRLLILRRGRTRIGDVVAVADPRLPSRILVKRVKDRGPAGLTVLGDNPAASTDSRVLGPVARESVRGRAFYRYFPDSRRGLL